MPLPGQRIAFWDRPMFEGQIECGLRIAAISQGAKARPGSGTTGLHLRQRADGQITGWQCGEPQRGAENVKSRISTIRASKKRKARICDAGILRLTRTMGMMFYPHWANSRGPCQPRPLPARTGFKPFAALIYGRWAILSAPIAVERWRIAPVSSDRPHHLAFAANSVSTGWRWRMALTHLPGLLAH